MIQGVFFDLDGTLIDSIFDIGGAMNRALHELGQRGYSIHEYYHMVGNGMKKLCERALPPEAAVLTQDLMALYQAEYLAHCCRDTTVYTGVPELLQTLRDRGYKLAVITNKPHDQAKKILDTLLPQAPLDVVWGQQPGFEVKPAPEVYAHVAHLLGVPIEHTLYCGDSDVDIRFAHNAGAPAVGCLWGFRGEAELKAAGADFLAAKPLDILDCLGEAL